MERTGRKANATERRKPSYRYRILNTLIRLMVCVNIEKTRRYCSSRLRSSMYSSICYDFFAGSFLPTYFFVGFHALVSSSAMGCSTVSHSAKVPCGCTYRHSVIASKSCPMNLLCTLYRSLNCAPVSPGLHAKHPSSACRSRPNSCITISGCNTAGLGHTGLCPPHRFPSDNLYCVTCDLFIYTKGVALKLAKLASRQSASARA
jgi:hypothetical protein